MRRNRLPWIVAAVLAAVFLGWLVVENLPASDLARLEAAYQADLRRWGNPDEIEWSRPPAIEPAVEGEASEYYARARDCLLHVRGSLANGLLGQWYDLSGADRKWVRGGEETSWERGRRNHVTDCRPALDLIARGARTIRSGPAASLREAILGFGVSSEKWVNDIIAIGRGDAALRCRAGDHRGAVDRVIILLRFADDLQRTGISSFQWRAIRLADFILEEGGLPPAEEERILEHLRRDLADAEPSEQVVARAALRGQLPFHQLARGEYTSRWRRVIAAGHYRTGQVETAIADATGIGLLSHEIASAWRRCRWEFEGFRRAARRTEDVRLLAEIETWQEEYDWGRDPVERVIGLRGPWIASRGIEAHICARLHKEAILLGLSLRREWRRTGRAPESTAEFCPPEVREKPGGRPWVLRPEPEGDEVRLLWSGDPNIDYLIRPPAKDR